MRRLAAAAAALLVVTGCSSTDPDSTVWDRTWQVTGIYTSADSPTVLPEAITAPPSVTFGRRGIVGTSGCARFKAQTTYFSGEEKASVYSADAVRINTVDWDTTRADCEGEALWAHNQFTRLVAKDNEFSMNYLDDDHVVLTLRDGKVDSPSLRLTTIDPS